MYMCLRDAVDDNFYMRGKWRAVLDIWAEKRPGGGQDPPSKQKSLANNRREQAERCPVAQEAVSRGAYTHRAHMLKSEEAA